MNPDPHFEDGLETVCFEAQIHGHPVAIRVSREVIEDHNRAESMTPDEMLDFVNRNRHQIIANVETYTRSAPDLTGIHLSEGQLWLCD